MPARIRPRFLGMRQSGCAWLSWSVEGPAVTPRRPSHEWGINSQPSCFGLALPPFTDVTAGMSSGCERSPDPGCHCGVNRQAVWRNAALVQPSVSITYTRKIIIIIKRMTTHSVWWDCCLRERKKAGFPFACSSVRTAADLKGQRCSGAAMDEGREKSAPDSEGKRQYCELCGKMENLLKCARCRSCFYCSKEHQKQHWKKHKLVCKEADEPQVFKRPEEHPSCLRLQKNGGEATSTSARCALGKGPRNPPGDGDGDRVKELITSTEGSASICDSGQPGARQGVSNNLKRNGQSKPNTHKLATEYIAPCMNKHGMCVVDNFLGEEIGMSIFANVLALRRTGRFTDGQLVSQKSDSSTDIRGDKITWIEGKEPGCENISFLMSCMDDVIRHCNGKLGSYKINGRTKVSMRKWICPVLAYAWFTIQLRVFVQQYGRFFAFRTLKVQYCVIIFIVYEQ